MSNARLMNDAKQDPTKIYNRPHDVLRDRRLNDNERLEILSSWERDARAMSVASDEAMTGGEPDRLSQVVQARIEVEERLPGSKIEHTESSKFGGGS